MESRLCRFRYTERKHETEAPGWKIIEEHEWNREIRFAHCPELNYDKPMVTIIFSREGFEREPVFAEEPYSNSYMDHRE